jgi:hypothetical protein
LEVPTDQDRLRRGILDDFCSCPMVRLVPFCKGKAFQMPRREKLFEGEHVRRKANQVVSSNQ